MEALKTPEQLQGIFNWLGLKKQRPAPTWQTILSAVGGVLFSIGFLQLAQVDDKPWLSVLIGLVVMGLGYGAHFLIPAKREFHSALLGVVFGALFVTIGHFVSALEGDNLWLTSLFALVVVGGLFVAPHTKGHLFILGAALYTLLFLFSGNAFNGSTQLAIGLNEDLVFPIVLLVLAGAYIGAAWYLSQIDQKRLATPFIVVGLFALFSANSDLPDKIGIAVLAAVVSGAVLWLGSQMKNWFISIVAAIALSLALLDLFDALQSGERWKGLVLVLFAVAFIAGANYQTIMGLVNGQKAPQGQTYAPQQGGQSYAPPQQQNFSAPQQQAQQFAQPQQQTSSAQAPSSSGFDAGATQMSDQSASGWGETPVDYSAPQAAATKEPNWYPDPAQRYEYRWHDGVQWTEHVSTNGNTSVDSNPIP